MTFTALRALIEQIGVDSVVAEQVCDGLPREMASHMDASVRASVAVRRKHPLDVSADNSRVDSAYDLVIPRGDGRAIVIRDDHVSSIRFATSGALAAAAVMGGGITAAAIVAAIVATVELSQKLRRKFAIVDPLQRTVLMALKSACQSLSPSDLACILNTRTEIPMSRTPELQCEPEANVVNGAIAPSVSAGSAGFPAPFARWSTEEVLTELRRLLRVRLADGTVEAMVAEDDQGRWSAAGV